MSTSLYLLLGPAVKRVGCSTAAALLQASLCVVDEVESCNVLVLNMENTSSPPNRGSVIVSRLPHVKNVDRLTYSSYQHSHQQTDQGQDWNLHAIEQRLAQPSLPYRRSPTPSHLHTIQARQELERDRIDLDEIYSKFSDLVKSNLVTNEADHNPPEEDKPPESEEEVNERRPVSDCHVCGDKAIAHLHYGGICCYSCKAFFRRAVQNGKDKLYKCKASHDCSVSVETRRSCQKCRFEKCLSVGMTANWVLSDEQCQIRFGRGKVKRKVRPSTEESQEPPAKLCHNLYSQHDSSLVQALMDVYEDSKEKISFSDANECMLRGISRHSAAYSASEMNEMVNTVIKRNIYFMENINHFSVLSHEDKRKLLTKNMTEMCHIRGALKFNPKTASFDMEPRGQPSPKVITQESIKNLYSSVNTARDIFQLMTKLSQLELPCEVMILLIPVVSLSSDGLNLEKKTFVEDSQVEYLNLIYRYVLCHRMKQI